MGTTIADGQLGLFFLAQPDNWISVDCASVSIGWPTRQLPVPSWGSAFPVSRIAEPQLGFFFLAQQGNWFSIDCASVSIGRPTRQPPGPSWGSAFPRRWAFAWKG